MFSVSTPFVLSLLVGFSSLSIEVLWIRIVSFSMLTLPQAFSYVLIIFLFGIAAGSYIGKRLCESVKNDLYAISAIVLVIAAAVDISSLHLLNFGNKNLNIALYSSLIFFTALLKSIVFPIAHHLGSNENEKVAASVSYVYFGNILGATLGPLITTFVLLKYATTAHSFYIVGIITLMPAMLALSRANTRALIIKTSAVCLAVCMLTLTLLPNEGIWYRLVKMGFVHEENPHGEFRHTFESQYGVINVKESEAGDIVMGFGMYDGRINTDPRVNSNNIQRAYMIAGLHANPKRVLVIGLSTGSWVNVISWLPGVESIDVVEMNPDYLDLIALYPEVSGILEDPKIQIYTDDGRRWLNRNPQQHYDMIVMNTTHHFRNNATNLLSTEFMELIKSRLHANGVLFFNATKSPDAFFTAAKAFKYAYRYSNAVAAGDTVIPLERDEVIARLAEIRNNSGLLFDVNGKDNELVNKMVDAPFVTIADAEASLQRELQVITDNNPVSEYKYGWLMEHLRKQVFINSPDKL